MRARIFLVCATALTTCIALIGAADVSDEALSESPYQSAMTGLSPVELATFAEGQKGFAQRWVVAPSILGLWGRGPTSNGEACTDCHQHGGRGRPSDDEREPLSMLVRLSVPGTGAHGAPRGDPHYGDQLQEEGILGRVPAEGQARIVWREFSVTLPDGERVSLRRPQLVLRALAFGPLAAQVMTSVCVAPPLIGVGLIDAV